jgi:DNA-binding MarR family transcriptional regulator
MYDASHDHETYVLARLLQQSADAMRRVRQKELSHIGVSTIEAATLLTINELGEQAKPSRIAECVLRRPNSMTALLKRMEQNGLVSRTYDLKRRNWVRMELTEYGREVLERVSVRTAIRTVMGTLSVVERETLKSALVHLRVEALNSLGEKVPSLPLSQDTN